VSVTKHPTADWTLQQMREVMGEESAHRYLIHDRDNIFATRFDNSVRALGLKVLRTPFRSPKANSICERVIGTICRELIDWIIPISETHLRAMLREWVTHYNAGRPHKMLGPGVPSPPALASLVLQSESRHRLPASTLVHAKSVLGGLHHEYSFAAAVA
jgi:putative transposase